MPEPPETPAPTGPVVDMSRSPYTVLRPVSLSSVHLEDRFWKPRLDRNRAVTIPAQLRQCEKTGRIDNFRRASGKKQIEFQGIYFNDSDVYKWIEAASFSLATHPDPRLEAEVDSVISEVAAAQQADGYLNTYYMFERAKERFSNLKDMHEIYCAGHLFQAAVAHHRATGKSTLLEVARRLADCLDHTFGPGKRKEACGHEEAEMGLVELYRTTGERRYLHLAQSMIEARGQRPPVLGGSPYHQDHLPFTEQKEMIGHAVRHLYLCCGAADVAAETGDTGYRQALETLWNNFTTRKMYVTGGAGSRYEGEAFGADYELPNDRAYTETCAAIGSVMWNWRMLNLTGEPRFADVMELTLYNAVLPGLSLDGTHYFYQNPLADRGKHRRQEWFGCACCPPNIARLLASLPGYFYSTTDQGVYVHLYAAGKAHLTMADGAEVTLSQKTNYPWEGEIEIEIESAPSRPFDLFLRIPSWSQQHGIGRDTASLEVHSDSIEFGGRTFDRYTVAHLSSQYVRLNRSWQAGDMVRLRLPMPVERIFSHPHVVGNWGRVALKRGPLVYCVEQTDNPEMDVWNAILHEYMEITPKSMPELLEGITLLSGRGITVDTQHSPLYAAHPTGTTAVTRPVTITAIPYYAWANRDAGPMQVWLPTAPVAWVF
jgi:DUF1680 family protein